MAKVYLDAGHQGVEDTGALDGVSTTTGDTLNSVEANLALNVTLYARIALMRSGVEVYMSRVDNTSPYKSPAERASEANAISGINRYVAIHFNSATVPTARGIEVFTSLKGAYQTVATSMASAVYNACTGLTPWVDRGLKTADFTVLVNTTMPACLLEGGFLTNTEEETLIHSREYQFALGEAVAKGVCKSLGATYVPPVPENLLAMQNKIDELQAQVTTLTADNASLTGENATMRATIEQIRQLVQ